MNIYPTLTHPLSVTLVPIQDRQCARLLGRNEEDCLASGKKKTVDSLQHKNGLPEPVGFSSAPSTPIEEFNTVPI